MPLAKLLTGLFLALAASLAIAAGSPDDVLVETAEARVTRADYDIAMARIPADLRDAFATSPQRLTALLNNILLTKTLAARARQVGIAPEPGLPTDTPADMDRALAAAETRAIEDAAKRDFDSRQQALVVTARETYLVDRQKYLRPEEVKISAILISTEGRGNDAALALAQATRTKLLAWADFNALAKEMSEDKGSAPNGGQLPWATAKQMDPLLAQAAFKLKVGEISEPVLIGSSYILIRMDDRHAAAPIPFDEVKDSIMATMRNDFVNAQREAQLDAIRSNPAMKVDQAAVDALVVHVDMNSANRTAPGAPVPPAPGK
jgi:hypothetical protein